MTIKIYLCEYLLIRDDLYVKQRLIWHDDDLY